MAIAGPAKADDIKRLQMQVDQLKERLDFISPMLPLVNFVQDFFQKVECEASLQLMRLQKARVMQHQSEGDEDGVSNAQLDTVKFLHFVTDAVIAAHPQRTAHQVGPFPDGDRSPTLGSSRHLLTDRLERHESLVVPQRAEPQGPRELERSSSFALRSMSPHGRPPSARRAFMGESPPPAMLSAPCGATKLPRGGAGDAVAVVPPAEPGTGGTGAPEDSPCQDGGTDGLVLGKGSWAAAYRRAQGARREALRLLCTSGIVTARELSDDLTVINEEHIEECVLIASEMLQTWPLDVWARQPQEAKKFFEARLTALYQRKFGEQKA